MQTSTFRRLPPFLIVLVGSIFSLSQNQKPVSDPHALALAAKALTALSNGVTVTDATLTGTTTWTTGPDAEKGTVTLKAKGAGQSRMDLALGGGNRSEIRTISKGFPQGAWVGGDGKTTAYASHNCWTDASWFFPALSSLAAAQTNPNVVLSYVGAETRNAASVEHLQANTYSPQFLSAQPWSTVDVYLDASSLLPIATTFNTHPDDDAGTNIVLEVDFSDYQSANGVLAPFRIQQFVQGSLTLDIAINSVALNAGLPDSDFAIQ
jgi:hypothetical protein